MHTNDPGKAIQYACELGELVNLKIDNMAEERRERLKKAEADQKAAAEKQQQEEAAKAEQPLKEYGMVAVSLGEGFSGIFGDLGVDHIVEGGQTMNPSIEDILDAVEKVGAKDVYKRQDEQAMEQAGEGEDPCHAGAAPKRPEPEEAYEPTEEEARRAAFQSDVLRGVIMSEILMRPGERAAVRRMKRGR